MKITGLKAFHCNGSRYPWVFIKIETDAGITGIGQASSGPGSAMVAAAASRLGGWLTGEDPSRIEYLWNKLFTGFSSLGNRGFASALISAVDIALWDIRGKQLGLPVYELLGGRFRDRLILYANGWFQDCETPDDFARNAKAEVKKGHTAMKLDPFMRFIDRSEPRQHAGGMTPAAEAKGAAIVEAIRDAVGPDVEILIDAHGMYDVPTAVRLARRLEPCNIGWFEEPVPPENYDALRLVREQIATPICVGERLISRYDFRPILDHQLANYLMPDIIRTGGISEMKKIATMAEAYYVPVSPHDATGPITMIAGAQVMMTVPNFYRLEIAYSELPLYNEALTPPLDVHDGYFHVSNRPGLGHELSEEYLTKQAVPF
ncbi:MAG: mandelate racemase/muconate lactonizing enzyme family protein [Chloroflexi bacterium]|nr:mandelate racemase/muconate lactonizing enzyme family protein [Chloroflexota bacterium]